MFRFPAARPAVVAEPLTPGLRRAAWVVMIADGYDPFGYGGAYN